MTGKGVRSNFRAITRLETLFDGGEVGFGIESMHGMRDVENNRRAYGDSAILRAVSLLLENL